MSSKQNCSLTHIHLIWRWIGRWYIVIDSRKLDEVRTITPTKSPYKALTYKRSIWFDSIELCITCMTYLIMINHFGGCNPICFALYKFTLRVPMKMWHYSTGNWFEKTNFSSLTSKRLAVSVGLTVFFYSENTCKMQ